MFFQIQEIIDQLDVNISPFEGSLIIKEETHQAALMSWLPSNCTYSLLYKSSTDGKTCDDFHRCCDNKGPTVVLVKSEEYIFGGYTTRSWESGLRLIHSNTWTITLSLSLLRFDWLTVLSDCILCISQTHRNRSSFISDQSQMRVKSDWELKELRFFCSVLVLWLEETRWVAPVEFVTL